MAQRSGFCKRVTSRAAKIGEAQEEFTRFGAVQIRRQKVPNPPRGVEDKWGREPNKISAHPPKGTEPRTVGFLHTYKRRTIL